MCILYSPFFFLLQGPTDIKSALEYLMTLFPRKLFNDALPQIVLKHQLYSIHDDKTLVDKEVVKKASYSYKCFMIYQRFLWMWNTIHLYPCRINYASVESCWCSSLGSTQKLLGCFLLQTTKPKCWRVRRGRWLERPWRSFWTKWCLRARIWASARTRCWESFSSQTLR